MGEALRQQRGQTTKAKDLDLSMHEISGYLLADEAHVLGRLQSLTYLTDQERQRIDAMARQLVTAARGNRRRFAGIEAFLAEYGLSSDEGIALMCLAEALLRIPDAETADAFISDTLGQGDWARHLGRSESSFVNASTWGLLLTGRVASLRGTAGHDPISVLKRLAAKSGEPLIRRALQQAMRLMGEQFILGSDIRAALKRSTADAAKGYRFSYDMLGEAALNRVDAERYFLRYAAAIEAIGQAAGPLEQPQEQHPGQHLGQNQVQRNFANLMARPGISIKLSALHPRFEANQHARILDALVPHVLRLAELARNHDLSLCIDAEEADKLDLSLRVFAAVLAAPQLAGWHGLGLAVQAYGKRAMPTLRWLRALSINQQRRIPVRLVKGAYWDSEIKRVQEAGYPDYPVFTRKAHTDISYLACARFLLAEPDRFYGQFATHNAHALAAIATLAGDTPFEFQRLHGMGEAIFGGLVSGGKLKLPCRIYAPVGGHGDLLGYLVRRLLENGANTSFVGQLADDACPLDRLVMDPLRLLETASDGAAPSPPRPVEIVSPARLRSLGLPMFERAIAEPFLAEIDKSLDHPLKATPIIAGASVAGAQTLPVLSPHDRREIVGEVAEAGATDIEAAVSLARAAQRDWDEMGAEGRAEILERAADLFERERAVLVGLVVREAGKTVAEALGELRGAADLLRYYAGEARRLFGGSVGLPAIIGERNRLSLHGRGVYACISPYSSPLAVFTGQIAAALAGGNAVIAKPAEQTPLVAFRAVQLLHEAGVPANLLGLLPGSGGTVGRLLINAPSLAGVAFTGSHRTAAQIHKMLAARSGPITQLISASGGINAMIADSSALPEQVTRDALRSAFGNAGQDCAATSLLFLQSDLAPQTIDMLVGAMDELRVGDPMRLASDIGPVIDEAAEERLFAYKQRMGQHGRELTDLALPDNCRKGTYVTPAAYEVDSSHGIGQEVFGPVLHIVRYQRGHLDKVCAAINASGFGHSLSIYSRIAGTLDYLASNTDVGNLFVNRPPTGAVAGMTPQGGAALSGSGTMAGGPHYLSQFTRERMRSSILATNLASMAAKS